MFNSKNQKTMSFIVVGIYLFLLVWLIIFKFNTNFTDIDHIRSINLIPFKESVIVNGRLNIQEILYNVLVFVPLGVYINIFKNDWSFAKKILPALCLSIIFELVQFIFAIGASDITDVIGNTLGGIVGLICYIIFKKIFKYKTITIINVNGLIIDVFAIAMLAILLIANM